MATSDSKPQAFYTVNLLTSPEIAFYWGTGEIPGVMQRAFTGARFNEGFYDGRPFEHTEQIVFGDTQGALRHAIATDGQRIVGGVFGIPVDNPSRQETCSIGWMFTSPDIAVSQRILVLRGLLLATATRLRAAHYKRIETDMGTIAGAGILRRFGFVQKSTIQNSWTYDL